HSIMLAARRAAPIWPKPSQAQLAQRIRLEGDGCRRDDLRALALRVEVAGRNVPIMRSKSELLCTSVAASSGKSAVFGVHSSVLKWRTRRDSNSRPLPSEHG